MSTLNVISKPKNNHHHKNIVTSNQMITQIEFIRYENIKTKLNRLFENTFYQTNIWNIDCCANNKKSLWKKTISNYLKSSSRKNNHLHCINPIKHHEAVS